MKFTPELFGCSAAALQPTCLLTPVLTPGLLRDLGVPSVSRGRPYAVGQGKGFSLILSPVGAGPAGDAVLLLKDTPCARLILLGSCGAVTDALPVGTLITPTESLSCEGFSVLLHTEGLPPGPPGIADPDLTRALTATGGVRAGTCGTFSSLVLESLRKEQLHERGIDVVDMESAAVFTAARHIGRPAAALLYVSDHIGVHAPYRIWKERRPQLEQAQARAAHIIRQTVAALSR